MTVLLPDASALRYVIADGAVELARNAWDGDAGWTEAAAADIPAAQRNRLDWLPEPIELAEPDEISHVERLRQAVFGGAPGNPTDYLDEAQILFLITARSQFSGALWISADPAVLDFAGRRKLPCRHISTVL
jgi:hypothetical protein